MCLWISSWVGAEPGGSRGEIAPLALWKKVIEVGILWTILWYFTLIKKKKKTPTLIHVQTLNAKKVGKQIFSHIPNHITSSRNLLFLLVLSHHVRLPPFHYSFFLSIIIFSLLFTTLFLWSNAMNTTNFTNWCVINHKKIHSNIYLLFV